MQPSSSTVLPACAAHIECRHLLHAECACSHAVAELCPGDQAYQCRLTSVASHLNAQPYDVRPGVCVLQSNAGVRNELSPAAVLLLQGDYLKPGGREPLLQLLGMVFSENITAVSRPAQLEQQPSTQGNEQSSSPAASPSKASTQVQDAAPTAGVAAAADAAGTSAPAAVEAAGQAGAAEQAAPEPHQAAAPEPDPEPEPEPVPAPRRMLGPAVPDARMLAAARAAAEMLAREEEQDAADFVGPAPPELMDEADAGEGAAGAQAGLQGQGGQHAGPGCVVKGVDAVLGAMSVVTPWCEQRRRWQACSSASCLAVQHPAWLHSRLG